VPDDVPDHVPGATPDDVPGWIAAPCETSAVLD